MNDSIVFEIVCGIAFVCVTTVPPICLAYMRRTERMKAQQPLPVPDIVARLERMEMGMESVSGEIERIGEGQRFTTRLLNEREPRALESAGPAQRRD